MTVTAVDFRGELYYVDSIAWAGCQERLSLYMSDGQFVRWVNRSELTPITPVRRHRVR